jgi:xanthine dehydrogenase YagS FAD-binding subunit
VRAFRYERPADARTAAALLAGDPGGRYLGGGTNLVDLMKLGVERPGLLVDINRAGLGGIEEDRGGMWIGAAVRNSDLAAHPLIRRRYPVLSQALLAGASGQLRNAATVGGNLKQRTRCRYFQDLNAACNKRHPGSGCPAIAGDHHNLAILGASPACVATHPSDMAVALSALDAVVHLHHEDGQDGERRVPVNDFYRLPGDRPEADLTVDDRELITAVSLPASEPGWKGTYRKVRERATFAFAVASVAAMVRLADDGTVADVRVALGAVAHRPWRARLAEEELRGGPADPAVFRRAVDRELADARPLPRNAYKVPLVRNLVVNTLTGLVER